MLQIWKQTKKKMAEKCNENKFKDLLVSYAEDNIFSAD